MAVKIKIIKQKDNSIFSISAKGHARFADHGYDIVCSAVSTLLQTAVTGIESVVNSNSFYKLKDGFLSFEMPEIPDDRKRDNILFLLDTIKKALFEIEKQYPKRISIKEEVKP